MMSQIATLPKVITTIPGPIGPTGLSLKPSAQLAMLLEVAGSKRHSAFTMIHLSGPTIIVVPQATTFLRKNPTGLTRQTHTVILTAEIPRWENLAFGQNIFLILKWE